MSLGEGRAPRFVRNIVVSSCLYFARYVSNTFTQPPGEMRLQAHIVDNFYTCENVFHAAEANQIGIVANYYLQNIYIQYHIECRLSWFKFIKSYKQYQECLSVSSL